MIGEPFVSFRRTRARAEPREFAWSVLPALCAAFLTFAADIAPAVAADGEAVQAVNAEAVAVYRYRRVDSSIVPVLFRSTRSETHGYGLGARLTAPVLPWLGLRWSLGGGQDWIEPSGRSTERGDSIATSTMLFVRDPGVGELGVGYQFEWGDSGSFHGAGHGIAAHAGVFLGSVADLELGFDWLRSDDSSVASSGAGLLRVDAEVDRFDLRAGPVFYAGNRFSVAPRFVYARQKSDDRLASSSSKAYGAGLAMELLAGPSGAQWVSFGAAVQYLRRDVGSRDRDEYRIGASISVFSVPAPSLRVLNRQRR